MQTETLLKLYKAVVLPKLLYASEVYASATRCNMRKLEPVHNTALRIATGAFRTSPISSLLIEAGVLSLSQLIKDKNMTEILV